MPIINQNYGGGSLTPLFNPASPADVVKGKRYYDENGIEQTGNLLDFTKMFIERYATTGTHLTYTFDGINTVGKYSFANDYFFENLTFPNATKVEDSAFLYNYCAKIVNIPSCTAIMNNAFKNASFITNVNGSNVQSVGEQAFYSVSSSSMTIKVKNCTSFGRECFSRSKITLLDFRGRTVNTVPKLGSSAFSVVTTDFVIVVPDALYEDWIIATNWATYASHIVKESEYSD